MNGHSLLLMSALLTSAMPAQAQAQDPPLFSAFKAYCLKAGGDADQIKLAVEMRGGKPANHPSGITATPWPMTATNWDITVLGHKMNLSVGTSRPAKGPATTNCAISSYSDESDSMEALQKWAGVPRDPNQPFPEFYNFYLDGATHKPLTDKNTFRIAEERGNIWTLAIIGKSALQLAHTLPQTPK